VTPLEVRRGIALCFGQLPEAGSGRTRRLLRLGDPLEAWDAIRAGRPPLEGVSVQVAAQWQAMAAGLDPAQELERHREAGLGVVTIDEDDYPAALAADRSPPGLIVWRGDLTILGAVAASVIGTRRCSRYGREVAFELGAGLSEAGVAVVSGLALGIDGAAHEGVVSTNEGAGPIAVVAGGLDRVYPRRHAALWQKVAEAGVVIAEAPLGVEPVAWRFPARNRIIAALGDVLVVVESGFSGGSMHTVRQADDRGRLVLAVPGSIRSPASAGTNQLLSEGCAPCRDVDDVLVALGLVTRPRDGASQPTVVVEERPLSTDEAAIVDALAAGPTTLEQLLTRTGMSTPALAVAVDELESRGRVEARDGWFEAVSP
jgi:DNA processing protein